MDKVRDQVDRLRLRCSLKRPAHIIVFHFDEAHELSNGVTVSAIQTVFGELRARICYEPVAVLSTSVPDLGPTAPPVVPYVSPSARFLPSAAAFLARPWSALPVCLPLQPAQLTKLPVPPERRSSNDQAAPRPLLKPLPPPTYLRSFEYQIKIGRPL